VEKEFGLDAGLESKLEEAERSIASPVFSSTTKPALRQKLEEKGRKQRRNGTGGNGN